MTTTLRQLAEQVIIKLSGGDQARESEIQFPDVVLNIKWALATLVKMSLYENIKLDDSHTVSFPYIYPIRNVPVIWDKTNNECYSIIPDVPLQIPGNRGIHEVKPNAVNCRPFPIILAGQFHFVKHLIQDEIVCWPKFNKLIYHKNIKGEFPTVEIDLILVTPDTLGYNDPMYLPLDAQDAAVQMVIKRMMPEMPQDKVNDDNKQI